MPKVITDNKWREFQYRSDVPAKVLDGEFDWTDDEDGYFQYRGSWYHISQFQKKTRDNGLDPALNGWDAYLGDSFFSGVVVRLSKDGEKFKVGTYIN